MTTRAIVKETVLKVDGVRSCHLSEDVAKHIVTIHVELASRKGADETMEKIRDELEHVRPAHVRFHVRLAERGGPYR